MIDAAFVYGYASDDDLSRPEATKGKPVRHRLSGSSAQPDAEDDGRGSIKVRLNLPRRNLPVRSPCKGAIRSGLRVIPAALMPHVSRGICYYVTIKGFPAPPALPAHFGLASKEGDLPRTERGMERGRFRHRHARVRPGEKPWAWAS